MVIQFKNIKFHNFCSYSHAEIDLNDKGYCLVSGRNNYKKDSALSNGSGKSTIWSAICFALTGETISGLKTKLKNRDIDENECWTSIIFSVDKDLYEVTRYIAPKSDLKIVKNSDDISGKGIRESEKVLSENLPDLTKDLIASTIILGQGMPNKLSSFSPSGRKDLLEKLTKSDFMIDDIKERIANRQDDLNKQLRSYEDSLLINNTKLLSDKKLLEEINAVLSKPKIDYEIQISELNKKINELDTAYKNSQVTVSELGKLIDENNSKVISLTDEKAKASSEEFKNYSDAYNKTNNEKTSNNTTIKYLKDEIKKLESIKDVCPTCGQHIPGVIKPDTASQKTKIKELEDANKILDETLNKISVTHTKYCAQINESYSKIDTLQNDLRELKISLSSAQNTSNDYFQWLSEDKATLAKLVYDRDNEAKIFDAQKQKHDAIEKVIYDEENEIKLMNDAKINIEAHIAVVKKIDTLVKRDFRGYLLYNIIGYLNAKAKEYSSVVFDHDDIEIYLDGNALDISYCGKLYEQLSGGEKQRVDIITQFAIRDLLQTYFNYSSNILVLDEITDNLDKVATGKIFDLIANKLKDIESVFIISHHDTELEIPIDSEIHVVKDENSISSIKEIS